MSEANPQTDWATALVEWRKAHAIADDHPALLTVQLMEVWHRHEQGARGRMDSTLEELGSDVASLGEGFAELQKQIVGLRALLEKPPKTTAEPALPPSVVIGIALLSVLAGFCLGRAFL